MASAPTHAPSPYTMAAPAPPSPSVLPRVDDADAEASPAAAVGALKRPREEDVAHPDASDFKHPRVEHTSLAVGSAAEAPAVDATVNTHAADAPLADAALPVRQAVTELAGTPASGNFHAEVEKSSFFVNVGATVPQKSGDQEGKGPFDKPVAQSVSETPETPETPATPGEPAASGVSAVEKGGSSTTELAQNLSAELPGVGLGRGEADLPVEANSMSIGSTAKDSDGSAANTQIATGTAGPYLAESQTLTENKLGSTGPTPDVSLYRGAPSVVPKGTSVQGDEDQNVEQVRNPGVVNGTTPSSPSPEARSKGNSLCQPVCADQSVVAGETGKTVGACNTLEPAGGSKTTSAVPNESLPASSAESPSVPALPEVKPGALFAADGGRSQVPTREQLVSEQSNSGGSDSSLDNFIQVSKPDGKDPADAGLGRAEQERATEEGVNRQSAPSGDAASTGDVASSDKLVQGPGTPVGGASSTAVPLASAESAPESTNIGAPGSIEPAVGSQTPSSVTIQSVQGSSIDSDATIAQQSAVDAPLAVETSSVVKSTGSVEGSEVVEAVPPAKGTSSQSGSNASVPGPAPTGSRGPPDQESSSPSAVQADGANTSSSDGSKSPEPSEAAPTDGLPTSPASETKSAVAMEGVSSEEGKGGPAVVDAGGVEGSAVVHAGTTSAPPVETGSAAPTPAATPVRVGGLGLGLRSAPVGDTAASVTTEQTAEKQKKPAKTVRWVRDEDLVEVHYIDNRIELIKSWDPDSEITLPFAPSTLAHLRAQAEAMERARRGGEGAVEGGAEGVEGGGPGDAARKGAPRGPAGPPGTGRPGLGIRSAPQVNEFELARRREHEMELERARQVRQELQARLNEMKAEREWTAPVTLILPLECRAPLNSEESMENEGGSYAPSESSTQRLDFYVPWLSDNIDPRTEGLPDSPGSPVSSADLDVDGPVLEIPLTDPAAEGVVSYEGSVSQPDEDKSGKRQNGGFQASPPLRHAEENMVTPSSTGGMRQRLGRDSDNGALQRPSPPLPASSPPKEFSPAALQAIGNALRNNVPSSVPTQQSASAPMSSPGGTSGPMAPVALQQLLSQLQTGGVALPPPHFISPVTGMPPPPPMPGLPPPMPPPPGMMGMPMMPPHMPLPPIVMSNMPQQNNPQNHAQHQKSQKQSQQGSRSNRKSNTLCRYFNTKQGCRDGDNCNFQHVPQGGR